MKSNVNAYLLLLLIFTGFAGTSILAQGNADRWTQVGWNADETQKIYIEKTHRRLDNGNKSAWAKYVVFSDNSCDLHLMEFDCSRHKSRVIEFLQQTGTGKVTNSGSNQYAEWQTPAPETIGEALFDNVCGEASKFDDDGVEEFLKHYYMKKAGLKREDIGVDYGIVTLTRVNLRDDADVNSLILAKIPMGDIVVLLDREPVDGWYNVVHVKSNREGWISGSMIYTHFTKNPKPPMTISGRSTGSNQRPILEVKNDSVKVMTLKLGDTRHVFSPQESKTISLESGQYSFYASAPNVIPDFGEQDFRQGVIYSWRFYIVTTRRYR